MTMQASTLCPRTLALLLLICTMHCCAGPAHAQLYEAMASPARTVLREVISEALRDHCPSAQQEISQEQRIIDGTRTALKTLLAETFSQAGGRPDLDPRWRCSCPSEYFPCGGRCYARLNERVEYAEAERQCAQLGDGAHLAVPRTQQQRVCVSGLAEGENVWLGVTDRDEEGVWMGADGRPLTGDEGHVWAQGQPDNYKGNEHCVHVWKVEARPNVRFGEWNDVPCTVRMYPMCQLPEAAPCDISVHQRQDAPHVSAARGGTV